MAYIVGYGRSGSTLLLSLLSRIPGVTAAGELFEVWTRGFIENHLCGCGLPFRDCPFWNDVATAAFGGMDHVDGSHIDKLREGVEGGTFLRYVLGRRLKPQSFVHSLAGYRDACLALYTALQSVSGAGVVVDSSKTFRHALTLGQVPEVDLRLVHLVRDSRAVAHSWSRPKRRPEISHETRYMDRYGMFRSTAEWMAFNGAASALAWTGWRPTLRIRYEDLVCRPNDTVESVARFLSLNLASESPVWNKHFQVPVNHTIGGNPGLFGAQEVRIHPDDRWRKEMPVNRRLLLGAGTLPLLAAYGYLRDKPNSPQARL